MKKNIYVEARKGGTFAVTRANAQCASAVHDAQAKAIATAKDMFPGVKPDIARVRHTSKGDPDQSRKGSYTRPCN